MKIRTQLIAGILIFAVLLIVLSGFIVSTNQQLDKLMLQEDLVNSIALEVGELGYLSNDYILYREPLQEERWNTKYAAISADIARISVDNPEQQAIAATIASNLKNTRSVFDDITASPAIAAGSGTGFIQLSWSRMAVQNQGMIFDAGRLAHLLREQADELRQTRLLLIFALMGTFVAFLFTSYFIVYRRMLRSIGNLQTGARIIGSGDFSHAIDESSDDEISDLAHSFNQMTRSLHTVTASKTELEREVKSRIRAEEELVGANARLLRSERDLIQRNIDLNALNEELSATQEELQQNIDELTRMEQSLRESEEGYRHVVEYAPASIYEISADGLRFFRVNDTMCRILGYTREELMAMSPFAILDEESRVRFRERVKKRLEGGEIDESVAYRILARDGRVLWVTINVRLDCTGSGNSLVVAHDITERKRAEDALEEAHRRTATILEGITDTFYSLDTEWRFTTVNPAAEKAPFGRPAAELLGRVIWDLYPALVGTPIHRHYLEAAEKHSIEHYEAQSPLNGKWYEVFMQGRDAGVDVYMRDITTRKEAEAALREALTEKEVLLSEIHHRVKNNLAAFISLLSLEGTYADTDAGRALKKDLQNRARSMALIHETLYRTGKFSNVDMEIYLTTLINQIAGTYEDSGRIRTIVEAKGVFLDLARATTAGLIITELVTNSFKYAFPPGFDCMAVRLEPCTIRVTFSQEDGTYVLTVSDNGHGLPVDLDPLATKSLGLKLVNFLARHQLRADVAVVENRGTEFVFRLNNPINRA
jgi:PAS domain S-box-containing protein